MAENAWKTTWPARIVVPAWLLLTLVLASPWLLRGGWPRRLADFQVLVILAALSLVIVLLVSLSRRRRALEVERSQLIDRSRRSLIQYRQIFDNSPVAIFKASPEGRLLIANREAARIAGYDTPREMLDAGLDIRRDLFAVPAQYELFSTRLSQAGSVKDFTVSLRRRDGGTAWVSINAVVGRAADGTEHWDGFAVDVSIRQEMEMERESLIKELQSAFVEVKTLSGLLPICSYCKKVRDDEGYWQQIERYISTRSEASFSHSLCNDCLRAHHPDVYDEMKRDGKLRGKS